MREALVRQSMIVVVVVCGLALVAVPPPIQPAAAEVATGPDFLKAKLVRVTRTSAFTPASPDPAGIAYLGRKRDRLLVSDSEVDEMAIYDGVNLFSVTRKGRKTGGATTTRFSFEPTGLDRNPKNNRLYVSDDDARKIYRISRGPDRRYGTRDDVVRSFSTRDAGNMDPEGLGFDTHLGHLLVADGVGSQVYRYAPGSNRRFDGAPPGGDDVVSDFDVGSYGAVDPEGIAYNRARHTMLVLDHTTKRIYELTAGGVLVTTISIAAARPVMPAGLAVAPASNGSDEMNLYIVDRGRDNDRYPRENDGRLYEMSVRLSPRAGS